MIIHEAPCPDRRVTRIVSTSRRQLQSAVIRHRRWSLACCRRLGPAVGVAVLIRLLRRSTARRRTLAAFPPSRSASWVGSHTRSPAAPSEMPRRRVCRTSWPACCREQCGLGPPKVSERTLTSPQSGYRGTAQDHKDRILIHLYVYMRIQHGNSTVRW